MTESNETSMCICGHTRNYHYKDGGFIFRVTYGTCREEVLRHVGNMVYLVRCNCNRFTPVEKEDANQTQR